MYPLQAHQFVLGHSLDVVQVEVLQAHQVVFVVNINQVVIVNVVVIVAVVIVAIVIFVLVVVIVPRQLR
jgi:hypothetical protein